MKYFTCFFFINMPIFAITRHVYKKKPFKNGRVKMNKCMKQLLFIHALSCKKNGLKCGSLKYFFPEFGIKLNLMTILSPLIPNVAIVLFSFKSYGEKAE